MHIITLANKLNMTYDFYTKHNMRPLEWKLNAMINKDKSFNNKLPVNWTQPLNRKSLEFILNSELWIKYAETVHS